MTAALARAEGRDPASSSRYSAAVVRVATALERLGRHDEAAAMKQKRQHVLATPP